MTEIKIDKDALLWIVIGILTLLVIYVVFFKGSVDANTVSSTSQAAQQAASNYGGMVGGC